MKKLCQFCDEVTSDDLVKDSIVLRSEETCSKHTPEQTEKDLLNIVKDQNNQIIEYLKIIVGK